MINRLSHLNHSKYAKNAKGRNIELWGMYGLKG